MKIKKMTLGALAAVSLLAAGCQADIDAPGLNIPEATLQANTTIADFKQAFDSYETVGQIGTRDSGEPYIVKGRVISCDATGNIYQSLVIQDGTAALNFSLARASLYTIYPLGQEVVVNLTGMYVGKYGGMQQVGDYYESGGTPQPGRMPYPKFANQSQLNGLPTTRVRYVKPGQDFPEDTPYCIVTTFDELPSAGEELNNMMCQLVEFHNVHFEGGGEETYAPYQETVNRTLVDQKGNKISVRNSGYSNFWQNILPEGEGTVRGILSYYNGDSPWQLLLRSEDDVIFSDKGKREDPYSVSEVLAFENNGQNAWAEGYIVGAPRLGISRITSNDDVIFGADGDIHPGAILLAASPETADYKECLVVQLPQGTRLREYANLLDNPERVGKKLTLLASFESYLGVSGLTDCPGNFSDFSISGLVIENPDGLGTREDPFSCNYLIANHDSGASAWVGGYVVGYVVGSDYETGVRFECPDAEADYNNQNLVLGPEPGCTDKELCVVVNTSAKRTELGLKRHPELFGTYLRVEGTFGLQYDRAAIVTISNYSAE